MVYWHSLGDSNTGDNLGKWCWFYYSTHTTQMKIAVNVIGFNFIQHSASFCRGHIYLRD